MISNDVLIIGAGAAGCTAAFHLAKAGQRVTLLEQKDVENPLENVKYSKLIQQFIKVKDGIRGPYPNDDEFIIGLFLGSDWRDEEEINEVIQLYKDNNLWD